MPRAHAELHAELEALAFASADALDRLRDDDESGVLALIAQRERVLTLLAAARPALDETVMDAARRAIALDADLLTALRTRLTAAGREIEQVTRTRRSLASYGATPTGSVFVERLT
jgi:hypothetical protein